MAFSLIAAVSAADTSSGATTAAINTTGANLLVVALSYLAGSSPTLTDSKDNHLSPGWTALTASAAGVTVTSQLYYCTPASVGSGHTFTVSGTDSYSSIGVLAFSGAAASTPFDQQNGSSDTSVETLVTGSITPTLDDEAVVAAFGYSQGMSGVPSQDASMTIEEEIGAVGGTYYGLSLAYIIQTTATAINPTWTWTNAVNAATRIASFKSDEDSGSPGSPAPGSPAATRGLWRSTILGLGHGGF